MKFFTLFFICCSCISVGLNAQQRVVAECIINYSISSDEGNADKDMMESLKQSTKTVYIKGNDSRTDLNSPSFSQSLIYNKNTGTAVVLREFGNNKLMTRLDNAKWQKENQRFEGMTLSLATDTKTILGYECKKALIQLKDGNMFTVYYATNIITSVKEFEYPFKDVPGLVLEYEEQAAGNKKIKYTATKINFNPVQASKFDIPVSGYRIY